MARIPFAELKLIPPGKNDPKINARIGILHVDAGNVYDLYEYFKERSGGIESHGHIRKNGTLQQYRDTAYEADANYKANEFALSFETQGYGHGEWTTAQLDMIKKVMLWCKQEHGIPLRVVDSWNDPRGGWGYHTLFGSPSNWTPVAKACPGAERIAQFYKVLVPWMKEVNTVAFTEDDRKLLKLVNQRVKNLEEKVTELGVSELKRDRRVLARVLKELNLTEEEIKSLILEES